MRKWILLISIGFVFNSCVRSDFKKYITAKNSFWYIFEYDSSCNCYKNSNYGYRFFQSGSLQYMNWDHASGKLNKFYNEDVKSSEKWTFHSSDSIAEIDNYSYKVLKTCTDSIHVRYLKSNRDLWFINLGNSNPDQLKIKK